MRTTARASEGQRTDDRAAGRPRASTFACAPPLPALTRARRLSRLHDVRHAAVCVRVWMPASASGACECRGDRGGECTRPRLRRIAREEKNFTLRDGRENNQPRQQRPHIMMEERKTKERRRAHRVSRRSSPIAFARAEHCNWMVEGRFYIGDIG
jgi:hypothetical protein